MEQAKAGTSVSYVLSLLQCLAAQEATHTSFLSPFHHIVCLGCKVYEGRSYLLEYVGPTLLSVVLDLTSRTL